MAEILPFRGIRYNKDKVGSLEVVTAPPYDVISSQDRDRLYEKNGYNVIRLILGKEFPGDDERNNRYSRAANFLQDWLKQEILKEDEEESIYVYVQAYSYRGKRKVRRGFISLLRLKDFGHGVLPHEETLAKPKEDRLRLLRACLANLSPIFTIYSDPDGAVDALLGPFAPFRDAPLTGLEEKASPLIDMEDEKGERHRLWPVSSPEKLKRLREIMSDKEIYLADGHHRYETALAFRNEMRQRSPHSTGSEPYNYLMAYLTNMEDEGLTILPTHRLIRDLPDLDIPALKAQINKFFKITELDKGEDQIGKMLSSLEKMAESNCAFGMSEGAKLHLLTLRDETIVDQLVKEERSREWKRLDVTILHRIILDHILAEGERMEEERITYLIDAEEAFQLVKEGKYQLAFFLNPTKVNQVKAIARAGERMPGKATYFYPKLLTGLVMRKI
ncbi:DUF1015 domain-containing protein [candidate division NPL-UPA2 bacterium]|nr:DUF1015 domain-containing protein [candidate division NPL-UPA2 bacterium]